LVKLILIHLFQSECAETEPLSDFENLMPDNVEQQKQDKIDSETTFMNTENKEKMIQETNTHELSTQQNLPTTDEGVNNSSNQEQLVHSMEQVSIVPSSSSLLSDDEPMIIETNNPSSSSTTMSLTKKPLVFTFNKDIKNSNNSPSPPKPGRVGGVSFPIKRRVVHQAGEKKTTTTTTKFQQVRPMNVNSRIRKPPIRVQKVAIIDDSVVVNPVSKRWYPSLQEQQELYAVRCKINQMLLKLNRNINLFFLLCFFVYIYIGYMLCSGSFKSI
jgi:hypothetical protein